MTLPEHVAIIGVGPAGLTAAFLLSREGVAGGRWPVGFRQTSAADAGKADDATAGVEWIEADHAISSAPMRVRSAEAC